MNTINMRHVVYGQTAVCGPQLTSIV